MCIHRNYQKIADMQKVNLMPENWSAGKKHGQVERPASDRNSPSIFIGYRYLSRNAIGMSFHSVVIQPHWHSDLGMQYRGSN